MPTSIPKSLAFGGVNDASHPLAFPITRSIRCQNWVPKPNGRLQLRYGYTQPTMSTVVASSIHTAAYFETWGGTQYILFQQSTALKQLALSGGAITSIATMSNGNGWGHFRANNKIHIGNGTDFKSWDGTTLRNNGIRSPNSTETAAVTVAATTATAGSFSTTTLSGYQLYMAYYNPNTGHVGNRVQVGSRLTIPGSGYSILLGGLPNISTVDSEWLKIFGRTPDGGEVPYWFTDSSGALITSSNTASTATITYNAVNYDKELPDANDVGSGFVAFAKVKDRIFAIKSGSPYIFYSQSEADAVSGNFVGRPEESWPADNAEAFPTGEVPIAIHGAGDEGWFFSKNHLIRWRESLRLQLVEPWIGPWPVGCGGQRLFVFTPRGPFWVDGNKRLRTFTEAGIIEVSNEYQRTVLAQIADNQLSSAEMVWEYNPNKEIDRLRVLGTDSSGGKVEVIHDFLLADSASPFGQGYTESHSNTTLTTLVGSGYTPFVPVRNTSGGRESWAGSSAGRFLQLNDGNTDNGSEYSADYISGPVWMGDSTPILSEVEIVGDEKITVSHSSQLSDSLSDMVGLTLEMVDSTLNKMRGQVTEESDFHRFRIQLTSHSTDGDFDIDAPYQQPLNVYGQVLEVGFVLGADRPLAR